MENSLLLILLYTAEKSSLLLLLLYTVEKKQFAFDIALHCVKKQFALILLYTAVKSSLVLILLYTAVNSSVLLLLLYTVVKSSLPLISPCNSITVGLSISSVMTMTETSFVVIGMHVLVLPSLLFLLSLSCKIAIPESGMCLDLPIRWLSAIICKNITHIMTLKVSGRGTKKTKKRKKKKLLVACLLTDPVSCYCTSG